jgi:hypothetical protein
VVSDETGLVDWSKVREEAFHFFLIVLVFCEALKFDTKLLWLDIVVVLFLLVDCSSSVHLPDECEDEQGQEADCG